MTCVFVSSSRVTAIHLAVHASSVFKRTFQTVPVCHVTDHTQASATLGYIFTVTLSENQDTVHKRIDSFKKGYLRGSPDLIINNLHKHYSSFAIEMKSPKGNGVLSPDQSMMLRQYQNNGFKTLVSNDYDQIIKQIIEYFRDV